MPVYVRWYNREETILYIQYHGPWTLDEFHDMLQKSITMTENSRPFVAIGDFSNTSMIPTGLLSTGRRIEQSTPSHRLMLILVQPNLLLTTLMRAVSSIYPRAINNAHMVSTLEEALTMASGTLTVS